MPKWFMPLFVVALVGLAATAAALMFVSGQRTGASAGDVSDAATPDPGLDQFRIPDFQLVDQDGAAVDASILDGRVTVLDFMFTNCPFACPGLSAAMLRLISELDDTEVQFVSITVDPERDTPERLTEYAANLGVDRSATWRFLTGDRDEIHAMIREHLRFNVGVDEGRSITLKDGTEMFNIAHPTKLFLIGPERQVIMLASFGSPGEVGELGARARAVAAP